MLLKPKKPNLTELGSAQPPLVLNIILNVSNKQNSTNHPYEMLTCTLIHEVRNQSKKSQSLLDILNRSPISLNKYVLIHACLRALYPGKSLAFLLACSLTHSQLAFFVQYYELNVILMHID